MKIGTLKTLFDIFPINVIIILISILSQQMFEFRVILYADQFVFYQFHNILLDLPVVGLYLLLHCIIAVLIQKAADFGNGLIGRRLLLYGFIVHHYLRMENLLLDCLTEVIGYRTDKHTLR